MINPEQIPGGFCMFEDFENEDDMEALEKVLEENPELIELADGPPLPPKMTDEVPEAYEE